MLELPFTEALAQVREGRIEGAKTVLLLRLAALWGPVRSLMGRRSADAPNALR